MRFASILLILSRNSLASATQPPGSSPDETAHHKHSHLQRPTHTALHNQSHLQPPLHPPARSKTSAQNNRTLPLQRLQTTHSLASDESDSNQHAARPDRR